MLIGLKEVKLPLEQDPQALAQRIIDETFPRAVEVVEHGVEHPPLVITWTQHGNEIGVALVDDDHALQRAHAAHHAAACDDEVAVSMLVCESWYQGGELDEQGKRIVDAMREGRLRIQDAPGAYEVITFDVLIKQARFICCCKIDRKKRTLERGELLDLSKMTSVEGARFQNLPPNVH